MVIVFSYSYGLPKVLEIFKRYSDGGVYLPSIDFTLPSEMVDIDLPPDIADRLDSVSSRIGEQFRLYGFRAKINFRNLLKCLAYRNDGNTVTDAEFTEFLELADFMNFVFNPI